MGIGKGASHKTGERGEAAAVAYLAKRGYRILARNWRPTAGRGGDYRLELDVVALHKGALVFVEVKSRECKDGPGGFGAEDNFTAAKRDKLLRAAHCYLSENGGWERPCRFDFVGVKFFADGSCKLELSQDVVAYRQVMDNRHAPWQPW